jgi:hypothetical protein
VASGDFDPERLFRAFDEAGVRFILVGGMAAILHGDVGVTIDLDIVPERSRTNLEKLAAALRELSARIRAVGEPGGVSFDCSAGFFANLSPDAIVNLTTTAGDVGLTFMPSGTRGFADLERNAVAVEAVEGVTTLIASLPDIIRSKEAADRDKDRHALPRLRRLLERLRAES